MEIGFKVAANIARPVGEVYEAVADPARLSEYFTTGGAEGRLETGATVRWDFADFPGAFPVEVEEAVPDRRIVLLWQAGEGEPPNVEGGGGEDVAGAEGEDGGAEDAEGGAGAGYLTRVTITFTPLDDGRRTHVEIAETGWRETAGALAASYGNCQGWSQMLCALKAWLEHGVRLREGLYV